MPAAPSPQKLNAAVRQKKDAAQGQPKAASDKQTPLKPADFGKAIGIDKPANVRDKIRKWQADLEGEISGTEDAAAGAGSPAAKPPSTPKAGPLEDKLSSSPRPVATPPAPVDTPPGRPKSAKKPTHNALDEDLVIATAPKKRVISDSHWRSQKSPPKDAPASTARPSPKPLPTAWVRPAARRPTQSDSKPKPVTPNKPESKPIVVFGSQRPTPRTRSARRRRPSRPSSTGNDRRPTSSGSGSSKTGKTGEEGPTSPRSQPASAEKYELVRVRRRRRSAQSRRSSSSLDENLPLQGRPGRKLADSGRDLAANQITVEYESTLGPTGQTVDSEKRRKSRVKDENCMSPDSSPRNAASDKQRRSRSTAQLKNAEFENTKPSSRGALPETPPNRFGGRLQAWLQSTPDPFLDTGLDNRRKSKDSISTPELPERQDKSETTVSSFAKDEATEAVPERKSGSKRKKRTSELEIQVETKQESEHQITPKSAGISDAPREEDAEGSPRATLKRRGARRSQHSPTKSRVESSFPETTVQKEDANSSVVSSSVISSSVSTCTPEVEEAHEPNRLETLAMRRIFPTTGKRLSTIASVETFATTLQDTAPSEAAGSEAVQTLAEQPRKDDAAVASEAGSTVIADTQTTLSRRSTRRNKLASHADLISVLSMPRAGTRSIVSARSIRTNRSRIATATIEDIMNELASDEAKYMRELRTLVDGVIPVLLSCVLSKSDSAVAAGLFSRSSKIDPSDVTKPIVDMGISLERLKSLHKRVPKDNANAFLSWTQSAQRVYADYISSWRLGFEDVVVSLAPADEDPFTPAKIVESPADAAPWDEGLPRNAEGYVVNGDGERVDVAYMLKRPLVRLKYLAKTIRGINLKMPSERTEKIANAFQDLVAAARKRSHDERARLEDEAAANIDPTRARDPRSLAPLAGVRIDPNLCVRARDHFDMHLLHSSGQELNCQVELLLRDNPATVGSGGDILLCEVDEKGRWLLLPPVQQGRVSARNGESKGEIVVMIRGYSGDRSEWSEVLSLRTDDEQTGFEWVQMLGLEPVPPQISEVRREPGLLNKSIPPPSSHASSSAVSAATGSTTPLKSRTPSPHELEVPLGERAKATSKRWGESANGRHTKSLEASPITPPSTAHSTSDHRAEAEHVSPTTPTASQGATHDPHCDVPPGARSPKGEEATPTAHSEGTVTTSVASGSPVALRRAKAKRRSKVISPGASSPPRPSRQIVVSDPEEEASLPRKQSKRRTPQPPNSTSSTMSHASKGFSVWMPTSDVERSDESDEDDDTINKIEQPSKPQSHRRVSSVPSMEFPRIPRIRKSSQPTTPVKEPTKIADADLSIPPASAPAKLELGEENSTDHSPGEEHSYDDDDKPPPVPPHRSPSPATPVTLKASKTPILTPTLAAYKTKRRSSSPLKHEYEPSTATESSSESEQEISDSDDQTTTSESSDGELQDDVPMPLLPVHPETVPKVSPPASIYTLPNGTITPSQSASNTPYRTVPQSSDKASRAIASIFSWADAGRWESLHPEECSIVITPGKVQVYEISAAHSKPFLADGDEIIQPEGTAPLIAVELTPLVPMRKSTAIDITIRSPPTAESRIKSGNNIMLRSRNPAECTQLYAMINQSRINNPTYIALQNARGPYGQTSWAEAMERQNAARTNGSSSGGWFSGTLGRRSSYRKTSTRAASISAVTESSVGTMNSALRSALGKFNFSRNGRFNIRGSTLGSRSLNSFDTGSSGSGSGTSTPQNLEPGRAPGAPPGITNTKCRLYERTSTSKWRDMGGARLSIMLPEPGAPQATMRQGKGSPGMRDPSQEKRILVVGKSNGETLLDATLGESCFERVARSGIAVSVWEDIVGPAGEVGTVGAVGGVSGAKARVYMIQMKSERECAYCFSLLGKLRY